MSELPADFALIKKVLQKERHMREYVFRDQPEKRVAKVAEIDAALEALERIEQVVGRPQVDLFGKD